MWLSFRQRLLCCWSLNRQGVSDTFLVKLNLINAQPLYLETGRMIIAIRMPAMLQLDLFSVQVVKITCRACNSAYMVLLHCRGNTMIFLFFIYQNIYNFFKHCFFSKFIFYKDTFFFLKDEKKRSTKWWQMEHIRAPTQLQNIVKKRAMRITPSESGWRKSRRRKRLILVTFTNL